MKPRKMSFSKMDPSCTFGFYLTSHADLVELTRLAESMGPHKIFELLDGTKEDYLALVNDPSVRVSIALLSLTLFFSSRARALDILNFDVKKRCPCLLYTSPSPRD